MSDTVLIAFGLFALVASITPGPNNLMLLASGVNFGYRRTIPHMLGVTLGFLIMLLVVGLGLAEFFARAPVFYRIVRWAGALYLVYLAIRIATSGPAATDNTGANKAKPFGFIAAAMFQWVNPKAWAMAVTAFSAYVPAGTTPTWILLVAILFALIGVPCVSSWVLFGTVLKRWLHEPRTARVFNVVMALLLIASLIPMMDAAKPN
jgi:threonine/homoserine/homoserine lactone efflux protein